MAMISIVNRRCDFLSEVPIPPLMTMGLKPDNILHTSFPLAGKDQSIDPQRTGACLPAEDLSSSQRFIPQSQQADLITNRSLQALIRLSFPLHLALNRSSSARLCLKQVLSLNILLR